MIYTVTFNPAVDYVLQIGSVQPGQVNRAERVELLYGGKGINVSWVLKNLGIESVALGFVAGFTGREIEQQARAHGLKTDFIHLEDGVSRINIKLKTTTETEFNAPGPAVPEEALEQLYQKLDCLTAGDILVLAGSLSSNLPADTYGAILERLSARGIRCVVDTAGEPLRKAVQFQPFLIKPNHYELGELVQRKLCHQSEIVECARKLREQGAARNVLVSMAEEGGVLAGEDGRIYTLKAPRGKAVNSTGAGDSMLAGFLAGYLENRGLEWALKMGVATGSASAFSEHLATRQEVERCLAQME